MKSVKIKKKIEILSEDDDLKSVYDRDNKQ